MLYGLFCFSRFRFMQDYKSKKIITPKDMSIYGTSKLITEVVNVLDTVNAKNHRNFDLNDAVNARNHLLVMITFGNAARASNLINMTVDDFNAATKESEYNAWCMTSVNYKTSLLYGEKKMLISEDMYIQFKNYLKFLRPILLEGSESDDCEDKDKPFFVSHRSAVKMTHSALSNAMTSIFKGIKEFANEMR